MYQVPRAKPQQSSRGSKIWVGVTTVIGAIPAMAIMVEFISRILQQGMPSSIVPSIIIIVLFFVLYAVLAALRVRAVWQGRMPHPVDSSVYWLLSILIMLWASGVLFLM